ncbi:DUF2716 domain-containing protein [Bacillus nakamurai]|uniref:DUF2716 domain-containing protein n=1 Tax=Bacillus nakamurai TaxID=1793963 RepID=UPI001E2F7584|nr:DUF2716 domain-containing protein [Bacillus nakamurai]MCC9021921.1 DUF2716 domain-containing protein [Bacillus nakamurai]
MSWYVLDEETNDYIWNQVNRIIKWKPGSKIYKIKPPKPYSVFDITVNISEEAIDDLELKMLKAFKACTTQQETMYALDWQHESYIFYPHEQFQLDEFGEWPVPIFPNGDYYFFFHKNFKWGVLGDPCHQTMTIFGDKLLNQIERDKPTIFRENK